VVIPEYAPPPSLRDPYVRRTAVDRATWTRAIRGQIPDTREIAAGHVMASYANRDGSNMHPGIARLAADLCCSPSTAKRALAWLVEAGWLTITRRGRRRLGEADVYQLTAPAPLAVGIGRWTEDDGPLWMERLEGEPKRPFLQVTVEPKKPGVVGVNSGPYNTVVGTNDEFLGVTESVSRGHSCDPPPGPIHQVLKHHSDHSRSDAALPRGAPTKSGVDRNVRGWLNLGGSASDTPRSDRDAILWCERCDAEGWLLDSDGLPAEPLRRCDHNPGGPVVVSAEVIDVHTEDQKNRTAPRRTDTIDERGR
jgi:helix-turn-helix protein